jgi:hypothetical protein
MDPACKKLCLVDITNQYEQKIAISFNFAPLPKVDCYFAPINQPNSPKKNTLVKPIPLRHKQI